MTLQRFALVVGLVLIGVGVLLGLAIPISVAGDVGLQSCGAPWTGGQPIVTNQLIYGSKATDYRTLCTDARQSRGLIALVLVGAGAIAVGGSFVRATTSAPALDKATPTT